MKNILSSGIVLFSLTSMIACTPINYRPNKAHVEVNPDQKVNVDDQLLYAAGSVQHSLLALAASKEPLEQHAINTEQLVTASGGMANRTSLDWTGPIEPLLYRLGEMTQYRLKVLGPTPPIPVIVTIVANNRRIADVVKDAGLQAGKKANIVVYPSHKIIELRYVPM